ncbi:NAD-dependent protein deacylase [Spectribacter hydrogenoxidans]|uniref:protein acetyllysine N-acetyltransferase n=1 Tax=Spectribacter hydrogenoxidans TaxID=3075608 RepID=A0ABU3C1Y6_9GAMM|nr:NAD-dependent protein deacylase [Salinisphaera sp. W335]MDT0635557.1 NAD-dependent protein deacylase [Salinisphaera sp. W335]
MTPAIADDDVMVGHDNESAAIATVAGLLARAERLLVITGAGMSADSGLPTYRGVGGLYNDGGTDEGIPIETALSGGMYAQRPALTWKYISQIEQACRGARPNAGHQVLAGLEQSGRRVTVVTQNVDGFHARAGSSDVIEMHGNLHQLYCPACQHCEQVPDFGGLAIPPVCPACDGMLRPRVVLFDEMLPDMAVARYEQALADGPDMVISIGTTAVFPYIAEPVRQAVRERIPTVDINPVANPLSRAVDHHLAMPAARALTAIEQALTSSGVGEAAT